jgi:hypothetical protein
VATEKAKTEKEKLFAKLAQKMQRRGLSIILFFIN